MGRSIMATTGELDMFRIPSSRVSHAFASMPGAGVLGILVVTVCSAQAIPKPE
jgi:hypothetical protein